MVITSALGVVHDLNTQRHCLDMAKLRQELSERRGSYVSVKGVEVLVFKLPGCTRCFGSAVEFNEYLQTS